MPIVTWHRENGILPEGRSRILLDNTLRMEDTRPEDQGRYICKGHNEGGNVTLAVELLVYGKYFHFKLILKIGFIFEKNSSFHQSILFNTFSASPSFIEAPSDVDVTLGGAVKLPCRAQGRPTPRIIWDRIGGSTVSQLHHHHHHQMSGKITQYLEKETQEDLLAKAKIMSLRSKRSVFHNKYQTVALIAAGKLALANSERSRRKQLEQRHRTFNQIMRDESEELIHKSLRKKRQIANADDRIDDNNNENDDNGPPDAIPILVFSTQAPEVSRLQVTDGGELILLDVSERDEVCIGSVWFDLARFSRKTN